MTDATADADARRCARCDGPTVSIRDAVPWCGSCEWNLDHYEEGRRRAECGWRWLDRRTHHVAYRLTRQQFAELAGVPSGGRRHTAARIVVVTASVLLLGGFAVQLAFAGWLLVAYPLFSPAALLAVILLAVAVAVRPRFGWLDPLDDVLDAGAAPELFRLVTEVAAAIGVRPPHVVVVDDSFNAYASAVGLRRRRVLCVGLPLWAALQPQERVALLGHELGHFANGDVRRGLLTQPAFTMLGTAAIITRPIDTGGSPGLFGLLADLLSRIALGTLSRLLLIAQVLLLWVGLRDAQRAEYRADELASRAAGTAAVVGLLDSMVAHDVMEMMVRREARAGLGPDHWRLAVAGARTAGAHRLPLLRQLSLRDEASLFASHPPAGLRSRLVEARPWHDPTVVLSESRAATIDAELGQHYERTRRQIALSD